MLALDALQVRGSLYEARGQLEQARVSLADVEVDEAAAAIGRARSELDSARSRTESRRWWLGTYVPFAGTPLRVTRDVVRVVDVASGIGGLVVDEGASLLRADVGAQVRDGVLDLDPLRTFVELFDRVDVAALEQARAGLARSVESWIPGELRDARAETLELADELVAQLSRARAVAHSLPGFLGADGPRRYFVGVQTSAELRGTGGLIGYWGLLTVEDGAFAFGESEAFEAADELGVPSPSTGRIRSLLGSLDVGVEVDPAFRARYGRYQSDSFFSNVNLDPDLPTVAPVMLDLVELRTGERLDGVILLDPVGMQTLLEVTGQTLELDAGLAQLLGREAELATDAFARLTTVDVYEVLGLGRDDERKRALQQLGDAALLAVFGGTWDPRDMLGAMAHAAGGRNLQVFSRDATEQTAFAELGVDGALGRDPGGDRLAVTANNAVGGKQDVHLGHEFAVEVALADVRRHGDGALSAARRVQVGVTVDNPLPEDGFDAYVIGNCLREDLTLRCFDGPPGWNWTWFTAWLPEDSRVGDTRTDESRTPVREAGRYRDFEVVDHHLATPPGQRASFELELAGRVPLGLEPGQVVYEWSWWRQAKATPDLLDVTIRAPEGWVVRDLELLGGGQGIGMGVHGDGRELEATVEGGSGQVRGTVTADLRVRVVLDAA